MPATAKICGLTDAPTMDAAIKSGASHVGFVFFPPSPRHLSFEQAAMLAARVPARVSRVGVFVNPDQELVERAVAAGRLDAIQLHNVTPGQAAGLRARTGRETWVALPIRTRADLALAPAFRGAVDRLVYDAKTPEGGLPGGIGLLFDWTLLDGFAHPLPWALSGGLDAANVAEAIARTGATLVDVSSGVETKPGVKDAAKIAAFLKVVDGA